jgi:hypothetical protein
MAMLGPAPPEDAVQDPWMSSRDGRAEFPAGAIAQAWMDAHSLRLTWDELTAWLRGSAAA